MQKSDQKKSVDEIIDDLPANEKPVVKRLRALVKECLPHATEKNSYGVPYYTHNRMICYIWPPSIYWEPNQKDKSDKGVTLGFCYGNRMANDDGALLAEGRKQVFVLYFKSLKEVNDQQVRALLYEADLIDQQFKKKGKKR